MNTGEWTDVSYRGGTGREPIIWCDICGWGDTVMIQGFPDDPYHFCHRHKSREIKAFMDGKIQGYFDKE